MRNMNSRYKIFLSLAIIYALFIFYLSSRSSFGDPSGILDILDLEKLKEMLKSVENSDMRFLLYPFYFFYQYPDKVMHTILYAGFGFVVYLTLKHSSNSTLRNYAFIAAIIIGTVYGASDEFHQSFVPGRSANIKDLYADIIGLILAQTIIFIKDKLYLKA